MNILVFYAVQFLAIIRSNFIGQEVILLICMTGGFHLQRFRF